MVKKRVWEINVRNRARRVEYPDREAPRSSPSLKRLCVLNAGLLLATVPSIAVSRSTGDVPVVLTLLCRAARATE